MWNMQGRFHEEHHHHRHHQVPAPLIYMIRSGEHKIATFVLYKTEFRAGEVILGSFDLNECDQICGCLLMEEKNSGSDKAHSRTCDTFQEVTTCVSQTSIMLALPKDAVPTFSSDLVQEVDHKDAVYGR
ncbi:unnamed protein product [Chrysoparadoxa australica]